MPQSNKKIILVSGVGGPAGINAARLLQNEPDVWVIGADIDALSAGRFFVNEFVISPRVSEVTAYTNWLTDIIAAKQIALFIPTVHEELPLVSSLKDSLPCLTVVSDSIAITLGDDKLGLYQWAEVHIPDNTIPFILLRDWSEDWLADEVQFIKPRQGRGGRGCVKVTKKELHILKNSEENQENFIVMKFMPGTEWTVDAYRSKNGQMVYTVPRERIGLAGGISIKGKTVRHESLIALSNKVCHAIGFYGPICLQWRADSEGVPKLIEINPRLSGGLPITVLAGVNPITAVMSELNGEEPATQSWEEVTIVGHFEYKKV
ncbi:MAG: ATP-grasp domain-containing protein [Patescibacteria group bacterium]